MEDNEDVAYLKFFEGIFSFLFEDFVQVGLQYFYFERNLFLGDPFMYINVVFMVYKAVELTIRILKMLKDHGLEETFK